MRSLSLKAFVGLLLFDPLVHLVGFGMLHRLVRGWPTATRSAPPDAVDRVLTAVNRACTLYPRKALCLHRSAVSTCLLRSAGVQARMVIGARKIPFRAHAWVEVDGVAVNEGVRVREFFQVLETC